jgi:hypothetical protein
MDAMREAWTDERLDDLNHRMDWGFTEVQSEFRALRSEMSAMNRALTQSMLAGFGAMIVGFAGTIATILSHG